MYPLKVKVSRPNVEVITFSLSLSFGVILSNTDKLEIQSPFLFACSKYVCYYYTICSQIPGWLILNKINSKSCGTLPGM